MVFTRGLVIQFITAIEILLTKGLFHRCASAVFTERGVLTFSCHTGFVCMAAKTSGVSRWTVANSYLTDTALNTELRAGGGGRGGGSVGVCPVTVTSV